MAVLYAILLGIVQGITEFLPVGSFGHVHTLMNLLGMQRMGGVLFETMLHMGTLYAVIAIFRKDIVKLLGEFYNMIGDVLTNVYTWINNHRGERIYSYERIVSNPNRRFIALMMVSSIPTFLIGFFARRLVPMILDLPMLSGLCFLITGIFILVMDLAKPECYKKAREVSYASAMWIGIFQGISVLPGLSRLGLTMSTARICGYDRAFSVKYSYLISIPAIIGAMLSQIVHFRDPGMNAVSIIACFVGMFTAAIVGRLFIRSLLKVTVKGNFRFFAYYCFAAGFIALICNYM